jgi:glyoxylase-like metal-dependent hydrolase (beta-lactamase superfamily II)
VLDRAANALGGSAALQAIRTVRYRYEGQSWERLQLPSPSPPYEANTQQQIVVLDLTNNRLRVDQRATAPGYEINSSVVFDQGSGTNYNHRTRTGSPATAGPFHAVYYRRVPQLLLREALSSADTLRHLGRDEIAGKAQDVITFVTSRAEQISLYVDVATGLISKCELIYLDPLAGQTAAEFTFSDYVRSGRHLLPSVWTDREADELTGRYQARVEIDPQLSDAAFVVPHDGYTMAAATPPFNEEVEQLADGVAVMRNIAGPNQHSTAVAFADHVVVFEAPGTSAGADKLIARIKETMPGKPIRYIVISHHHGDHIGGLRSFIAEGATVITTPGNRAHVEALARAPQFDRLQAQPRKVEFLIIDKGKHVLRDSSRTLELFDIGPNPHAREMLIAYLPRQRLLFQADVFNMPYSPRPLTPVQALTRAFAERVRELGLEVERIVGVHGPTAKVSDFSALTGLELSHRVF